MTPAQQVTPPGLTGRRAEAARNDEVILATARQVFLADPGAPVSAVAQRAGVGMSALYRRFPSKEHLLRHLCLEGLRGYVAIAEEALAIEDPWLALTEFLDGVVLSDVHTLTVRLAGRFDPGTDTAGDASRAATLTARLVRRAVEAGALRKDFRPEDVTVVLDLLSAVTLGTDERTAQLRRRYLTLILDGMKTGSKNRLPGPPPSNEEFLARWKRRES